MRNSRERLLSNTSYAAIGAALAVMATLPSTAHAVVELPDGCVLLGNQVTCTGTVGSPEENVTLYLETGQNLTNNATFYGTVLGSPATFNTITNNLSQIASDVQSYSFDSIPSGEYNNEAYALGVYVGSQSQLNNNGLISATATVTLGVAGGEGSSNFTVYADARAIGVERASSATIFNSGDITALASQSATITNFYGDNSIFAETFAAGIYGSEGFNLVQNDAGHTVSGTAINAATLSSFESGTVINGPTANAGGIIVGTGSVVDNRGIVTATATSTLTASEGYGLSLYGAQGDFWWYVPQTSGAVGIAVDHMANITNSGTVTATASLTVSLTDVSESYFGSYNESCEGDCVAPGAGAIGIYVGAQYATDQEELYEGFSVDSIINSGTVTATATTLFTLNNSTYNYVDTYSFATGILVAYTEGDYYYECYDSCLPSVWGRVSINNSGTVTATATTTLNYTFASTEEMSPGDQSFYLHSDAVGIAVYRNRSDIGGGEGGGPIATIINDGTVSATATTAATLGITDYYGSFYVNAESYAVGIYADSARYSEGPDSGPTITNNGTINATANTSVAMNYTATEFGWGEVYLNANVYAAAGGIVLDDGYGIVHNYGPVNATANASLSITSMGDGYVALSGSVYANAVGIAAVEYSSIYNYSDVTATATASVTVNSESGYANAGPGGSLYISSSATGLGGAEGFAGGEGYSLFIRNDGNVTATATSLYTSNAPYFDGGEHTISIRSEARGIYVPYYSCCGDEDREVVNNGSITAMALSAYQLTNPGNSEGPGVATQDLTIRSYAAGIEIDGGYGTVTNSGTIIAVASTTYTLIGFESEMSEGGYGVELKAKAYGIYADGDGSGYSIINPGTIFATATVTVTAPNYYFYGDVHATAYGIKAGEYYFVSNPGSIFATAYVTLPGGAEGNVYGYGYFWDHGAGNSSDRPARAYGIKIDWYGAVTNDGTIWANSFVSVGGTILQGENDPSSAFGIYATGGNIITNRGTVGVTRIGPMHWAVFMAGDGSNSQFYNYGTTIGSIHVGGTGDTAQNFGTMAFRTLQPTDGILQTDNGIYTGELWARYGTYDRIVVHTNASFDTSGGQIVINPLGNAGLYGERTRFRYFVDCGESSGCTNVTGLTTGQQPNLTSTSAFLVPSLDTLADPYNGTQGYDLILTRLAFTTPNLPGNQGTLGGGLEGLFNAVNQDPNGALAGLLAKIQVLGAGDVPGAYQQLAGEIISNASEIGYANAGQLLGMLFGRLNEFRGGLTSNARSVQFASRDFDIAQAPPGASRSATAIPGMGRWMGFVSGYGQTGQVDSQPGISGARFNVAGGMAGIEYTYSEAVRVGFTLGAGSSWLRLQDLDSRARGTFFQAAIYGSYAPGPWYIDGAVGYARHSISTERSVVFPGFANFLEGSTSANQFIGGFEAGWRFNFDRFQVTPFFGMQMSVFSQNGYTETGGVAALSYEDDTTVSARSSLGVQVRTTFNIGETMRTDPYARVAWAHEFGDRSASVTASFTGAPTSSFEVTGARRARDTFLLGAGFEMNVTSTVGVFAGYSGDISSSGTSHAGSAGIRIRW